jgi:hypothetical protein
MSATTGGALKAWIEAGGLGIAAYRDSAPENATWPHVVVHEGLVKIPDQDGDTGDTGATHTIAETVQVSLWQQRADEFYTLPDALVRRLHGTRLPTAPTLVYAVLVASSARLPDEDPAILHDAITVTIHRVV